MSTTTGTPQTTSVSQGAGIAPVPTAPQRAATREGNLGTYGVRPVTIIHDRKT
jgi:hypothetical protein